MPRGNQVHEGCRLPDVRGDSVTSEAEADYRRDCRKDDLISNVPDRLSDGMGETGMPVHESSDKLADIIDLQQC